MEVRPHFQTRWLVSVRLWGVVFYCVATVSAIEVQLWRLTSTVHACQRDYRQFDVLLNKLDE